MATPIYFFAGKCHIQQLKAAKNCKTCLTNHTHHIMPLVINDVRGRHTDRQTDTYGRANHTISKNQACTGYWCVPGLTTQFSTDMSTIIKQKQPGQGYGHHYYS